MSLLNRVKLGWLIGVGLRCHIRAQINRLLALKLFKAHPCVMCRYWVFALNARLAANFMTPCHLGPCHKHLVHQRHSFSCLYHVDMLRDLECLARLRSITMSGRVEIVIDWVVCLVVLLRWLGGENCAELRFEIWDWRLSGWGFWCRIIRHGLDDLAERWNFRLEIVRKRAATHDRLLLNRVRIMKITPHPIRALFGVWLI